MNLEKLTKDLDIMQFDEVIAGGTTTVGGVPMSSGGWGLTITTVWTTGGSGYHALLWEGLWK